MFGKYFKDKQSAGTIRLERKSILILIIDIMIQGFCMVYEESEELSESLSEK